MILIFATVYTSTILEIKHSSYFPVRVTKTLKHLNEQANILYSNNFLQVNTYSVHSLLPQLLLKFNSHLDQKICTKEQKVINE